MKKKFIFWLVIIILGGAGYFGYAYFYKDREGTVKYKTVKVERGSLSSLVTANGTVNPVTTVLVGSQISGMIKRLYADYNSQVKKGQLIAEIDPDIFQAQVSQAKAKLENAKAAYLNVQADILNAQSNVEASKANVIKTQVALEDARRNLKRVSELFSRNLIAASDRDAAQTAYDSAAAQLEAALAQKKAAEAQLEASKARLESARAQIKQAEAELEIAQVNLNHTRITAPVNGIVISRNVDVGQTVAASLQAPTLFTIAQDLTDMQVETNVSEADIGRVHIGQPATFTVDAFPQLTFQGKVTEIRNAPQTIQNVVTYNVIVQVKNPDLKLRPGMTANVSILVAQRDNVLKIPNAALRFRPDFARKEAGSSAQKSTTAAVPPSPIPSPEQTLARLKKELQLTPAQEGQIKIIFQDAQKEIQAVGRAGDAAEFKNKIKEVRQSIRQKIRGVLTEEQKKKYALLEQSTETAQAPAPVFKVWILNAEGKPTPVEISTGISDGSFTEVISGNLREGQEVIIEASGSNTKPTSATTPPPGMRLFR
ncbi:MAG: efflux RND transporter periplasmic adaptor subunit [bacterium]